MSEKTGGVRGFEDLRVYQEAFKLAMELFELSKTFPKEETYSLTDQIRRSSRAVTAEIAEAWEHRCYERSFSFKIGLAAGEASETQNWIRYVAACCYAPKAKCRSLNSSYDRVMKTLRAMALHSHKWCAPLKARHQETGNREQQT